MVSVAVAELLTCPLAVTVYENEAGPLQSVVPVTPTVHTPASQEAGVVTETLVGADIAAAVAKSPSVSV